MNAKDYTTQLIGSVEKLLHYMAVFGQSDTTVTLFGHGNSYAWKFRKPAKIVISPTLYTRIDGCHGAGNCCRVPFDLVYTQYDRDRINSYNPEECERIFGKESVERFNAYRSILLKSLVEYTLLVDCGNVIRRNSIFIMQNTDINPMSDRKSCPFLFIGKDRYFCGIHPFKPLHCWMPHMTVRASGNEDSPSISIGRMQYGRNHNFGCPVIFKEVTPEASDNLFDSSIKTVDYFQQQFQDDVAKLEWVAMSARSAGFDSSISWAPILDFKLKSCEKQIRNCISTRNYQQIQLI